jgi:phage major head subunit gpT-like protein
MKTKTTKSKVHQIRANAQAKNDLTLTGTVTIAAAATDKPAGPRRFEMNAYFGGPLVLGFSAPVVVDLATLKGADKSRPVLKDHDKRIIIGHTEKVLNDGRTLTASGIVSGSGLPAKEVVEAADNGFPWAVSIGATSGRLDRIKAGESVTVNSQTFTGPLLVARGAALKEISFVSIGADEDASARIAATAAKDIPMDFEQWLEARGFTVADLSDTQKASLEAMYKGEKIPATKSSGDLDTVLGQSRDREKRRKDIVNITAKALQDSPGQLDLIEAMSRQAVDGDWDTQRYELELLRATRPQATLRSRSSSDDGLTGDVIEAALCLTGGMEKPETEFADQTLEAASKRYRHGLGLGELLMLFARRNGYDGLSSRNVGPMLRAAFAEPDSRFIQASGISTLSLPGILSNVANKFLKMGFDSVEDTWRSISSIRSVRDFKQISSYALTGDFEYIELAPGGQIKHATVGEDTYTNQAKTYARMFGIDRRDIINDDLDALTAVPKRLGRGGALKFNLVFWTAFMNNASFFASGEANYLTGVTVGTNDSRLNIEGLTRAETAFLNQTDSDGKPLAVTPRILLVPNALNVAASQLMGDTQVFNNVVNAVATTGNPHAGKFTVVRSSYLSSSAISGNSALAWYLIGDPNDVPVIESAFLNGVQTPTVEQADADFNQLGIQMRGYHDFGVALQEPKGGVKSKGEA